MEEQFALKEIVWAKVKNFPWWPAEITALPSKDNPDVFKVAFIAETNFAHLHPQDVQKYIPHYDQYSHRKSKGLQQAVQNADELLKRRALAPKRVKKKIIKKMKKTLYKTPSQDEESVSIIDHSISSSMNSSSHNVQSLSSLHVDRSKIQALEDALLDLIDNIKQGYQDLMENQITDHLAQVHELSHEELLQSKITNMIAFVGKMTPQGRLKQSICTMVDQINQKIWEYLSDTTYYDQHVRNVSRNKQEKNEFQSKLHSCVKNNYQVKKDILLMFVERIGGEVAQGVVRNEKQLLEDIKERVLDVSVLANKIAVDKMVDTIIQRYS